jgi:hypothetical protein
VCRVSRRDERGGDSEMDSEGIKRDKERLVEEGELEKEKWPWRVRGDIRYGRWCDGRLKGLKMLRGQVTLALLF